MSDTRQELATHVTLMSWMENQIVPRWPWNCSLYPIMPFWKARQLHCAYRSDDAYLHFCTLEILLSYPVLPRAMSDNESTSGHVVERARVREECD